MMSCVVDVFQCCSQILHGLSCVTCHIHAISSRLINYTQSLIKVSMHVGGNNGMGL